MTKVSRQAQVCPHFSFLRWASQQVRRVVRNDERHAVQVVLATSHAANRLIALQQVLRSNLADGKYYPRLDQFDLALKIRSAGLSLTRLRVPIVRRTAFQHVGDEDGIAIQPDRSQHFVQHLSGSTDEWLTATILFGSRRLADYHPAGVFVADAKTV